MRTLFIPLIFAFALPASAALDAYFEPHPETCDGFNGYISTYPSGGVGSYTFAWTGPNGFTASTADISGLEGGYYTLTLTDSDGTSVQLSVEVEDLANLPGGGGESYGEAQEVVGYWGGACEGLCNGAVAMTDQFWSGTPPFYYEFSVPVTYVGTNSSGYKVYSGFCLGDEVNYTFTDATGCSGGGGFTVFGIEPSTYPVLTDIQGSCTGSFDGSMRFMDNSVVPATYTVRLNGQVIESQLGEGSLVIFDGLAPGVYTLSYTMTESPCANDQQFTIPDLGPGCGTVSGRSWYDVDGDCILDAGEVGIPNRVLAVEPGGYYAITQANGNFHMALPDGNYTLTQTDLTLVPICPPVQPVPLTVNSAAITLDLANGSTAPLDLSVWMNNTAARPGFNHAMFGHVRNETPQLSGPVTATLTYDPALTFLNATPAPTSIAGNVLMWEWPAFVSFEARSLAVNFNVPVSTPLGTLLSSTFSATNTLPEPNTANNIDVVGRIVTGSYDPNVKEVATSSRSSEDLYLIGTDEYLDYTIQFQNTGTDTAFTVVITDTLSAAFDMASFQQGASSHPFTVNFKAGRVVEWTFANILLPDSNTNEAASHGLTSFRIRLNDPVAPGTVIENIANIYFDYNPPVITEPSILTVTSPGIAVSPRVFLGGPYTAATQDMSDGLRASGLIPLTEPYTALGYPHVNGGGEATTPAVLAATGDNAIVDWVVMELRDASTPGTVLATRSALVQRDGDVVDVNGTSPVFFNLPGGNYHIAIRHRNHLGCMSANAFALSSTPATMDFSATATWGTDARNNVNGTMVLWAGDCRGDGDVKYVGDDNDRDLILLEIGGVMATAISTGYRREDANMDGKVKYTGANNDRDLILLNIGGVVPTGTVIEQLP